MTITPIEDLEKEIHKFNDFAESVHILTAKITTHTVMKGHYHVKRRKTDLDLK